jgi:hypothetical protein
VAVNNDVAVDAAIIDLSPAIAMSSAISHSMLQSNSSSDAATAADSRLTIIRPAAPAQSFDDSDGVRQDSSEDTSEALDQIFASLDESHLLTEFGLFSGLL